MRLIFVCRLMTVFCLVNIIGSNFAVAQNSGALKPHAQPVTEAKEMPPKQKQTADQNNNTGFACTDIRNINKIDISAFDIEINNLRARAIPGIANSFNLFEVRYKVSNNSNKKIWVSGEFIFSFDGNLTGAVSTNSGLTGILPDESEIIKSEVLSKDIFFKTKSFCYRFSVEQQQ